MWEFFVGARSAVVDTSWDRTLDVNGDGFADVLVSGRTSTSGPYATYLYTGSTRGLAGQPSTLAVPQGSFGYGLSVASVGDVNGDGFGDVAISAYEANGAADQGGVVYVSFGSADGLTGTPVALPSPKLSAYQLFGTNVDGAGDVNGDGYANLVVSATAPGQPAR